MSEVRFAVGRGCRVLSLASPATMMAGWIRIASWPWSRRIPGWSSPRPRLPGLTRNQPDGCRRLPARPGAAGGGGTVA